MNTRNMKQKRQLFLFPRLLVEFGRETPDPPAGACWLSCQQIPYLKKIYCAYVKRE